jgi:D-aspartate ligase
MNSKPEVPAVVVAGTLNSLGVIRSLSHGQMPIYVVSTTRNCAAGWSRFCKFVQVPSLEGRSLIDSLKELGVRLGNRPVLILTADHCVNAVSEHGDEIQRLYRISLPGHEMVRALSDKVLFQKLAEQEDFAVPRSVGLESVDDLSSLERLVPPVIVKPADKTLVLNDLVERAVRANTLEEARNVAKHMLERAPQLIAQEWIDGPDDAIFFALFTCDRDSNLTGLFLGRKLVCDPPEVGSTAVCVEAPEVADELRRLVMHFISRVGYRGLGSLEFKRDARNGRFIIVEPTVGRTDWQEEIATLCGVNLPLITYWAELGRTAPANGGMGGRVAWRSTFEHRIPSGTLQPGTRVVDGFFRWADPLPAIYYYGLERFAVRIVRRLTRLYRSPN